MKIPCNCRLQGISCQRINITILSDELLFRSLRLLFRSLGSGFRLGLCFRPCLSLGSFSLRLRFLFSLCFGFSFLLGLLLGLGLSLCLLLLKDLICELKITLGLIYSFELGSVNLVILYKSLGKTFNSASLLLEDPLCILVTLIDDPLDFLIDLISG